MRLRPGAELSPHSALERLPLTTMKLHKYGAYMKDAQPKYGCECQLRSSNNGRMRWEEEEATAGNFRVWNVGLWGDGSHFKTSRGIPNEENREWPNGS
ncbi:hypothetical protein E3N88_39314 [Mikania micrantha]|uniref:Uncharacterized protein n=1 Tax=Mikania micrantha TaxID=192012 RepID=A0A5N6LWM2_9ASTR|nr:hypothetical protein E3N88_39314 [Mikania micrantha]